MVAQQRPVLADDHHRDVVEADGDIQELRVVAVLGQPGGRRDLPALAGGARVLARHALVEAPPRGDVGEHDRALVVAGDDVDPDAVGCAPPGLDDLVALVGEELSRSLDGPLVELAHG